MRAEAVDDIAVSSANHQKGGGTVWRERVQAQESGEVHSNAILPLT